MAWQTPPMPGVRIVTDSACDLTDELVATHNVIVVPLTIRFGEEELEDRRQLFIFHLDEIEGFERGIFIHRGDARFHVRMQHDFLRQNAGAVRASASNARDIGAILHAVRFFGERCLGIHEAPDA